ncbi:hypothetical protein [Paracidovorax sp. MALMAid1276]|uniref:hypothetical protein n=1 Tax=Paracidovorax sp. MALMAid1276 TaxID=3411631 RepID=UPI003B99241D
MASFPAAVSGGAGASSLALQAARRNAQQAEQVARTLRSEAQSAQRSADAEQARADSLKAQSADADDRSAGARRNVASVSQAQQVAAAPPRTVPFMNASGQATGLLLNAVA